MSIDLEKRHKNFQFRNTIGCVVSLITLIIFCSILIWLPQLYNNWQLQKFANNLFNYPLPPQTEVISRSARVGLMGNGNHCDFVVSQIMRTQLTLSEIETYYDKVLLPPVNNHNAGVSAAYRGKPLPIFVAFDSSRSENGWQFFTIKLVDYGYAPGLDIRCH